MAGTITRITIGPTQNHTDQPVSACMPSATNASDGTTRPISQRWRFRSFHCSVEPAGTVLWALMRGLLASALHHHRFCKAD